jgi:hypothetical protein
MGAAALVTALSVARFASGAEPSAADRETSRDLYAQGVKALAASDYSAAERACGGAVKLVQAPTGAVCWGKALEGLGQFVEARDAFLAAAHYLAKPDEPPVFAAARVEGRAAAERVERRIATIVLTVTGPDHSTPLRVAIDGAEIASGTSRLPRKLNPGRHVVLVASPGYRTARLEVTAEEGQEQRVEVRLRTTPPGGAADAEPAQSSSAPSRTPAFVALGVGATGLVVGSVFGAMALSDKSTLDSQTGCPSSCPASAQSQIDALHSHQWASDIGLGIGVIGVGVGAVLLVTSSHGPEVPSVGLGLGPGAVRLQGRF